MCPNRETDPEGREHLWNLNLGSDSLLMKGFLLREYVGLDPGRVFIGIVIGILKELIFVKIMSGWI